MIQLNVGNAIQDRTSIKVRLTPVNETTGIESKHVVYSNEFEFKDQKTSTLSLFNDKEVMG